MTQWVENATGGRSWGPLALVRSWVDAVARPRRLFERTVTPGDQAPALLFAMGVVLVEEGLRLALVPDAAPVFLDQPTASLLFVLALATVLVAPAVLHLVAAVQTLVLAAVAPERGGVSETVQVIAYSTAPCAFAGIPEPWLRAACAVYGAALLTLGMGIRHGLSPLRALAVAALPNVLVFGYAFRGFEALASVYAAVASGLSWLPGP